MFLRLSLTRSNLTHFRLSQAPLGNPHPHSLFHKQPIIHILLNPPHHINQTPTKPPTHLKEQVVQFNPHNFLTRTSITAISEDNMKRLFHLCELVRGHFEPSLGPEDSCVLTIDFRASAVEVPCAVGDFGMWGQVDPVLCVSPSGPTALGSRPVAAG